MTGRCEWCLKRFIPTDTVLEHRAVSEAPSRGGRTKLFVTRFHAACDAERKRDYEESKARAQADAERDRAAMLAALTGATA